MTIRELAILTIACLGLVLMGCGAGLHGKVDQDLAARPHGSAMVKGKIKLNQLGFLPQESKYAVVPELQLSRFEVRDAHTDSLVFAGQLSELSTWPVASEAISIADFSEVRRTGSYYLHLQDGRRSAPFSISEKVFNEVHDAALKSFYFNRAGIELEAQHAGKYARAAGHHDDEVEVHVSAATEQRPQGSVISAPKGWYDAGDFGKYVVNSGISTFTLLFAYQQHREFYQQRQLNLPESSDGVPDILNEIKWNLDWLLNMQDPSDGGVYHKLTTLQFAGSVMPAEGVATRYVVQKGTAASLNFAATLAQASRVYSDFESQYPGLTKQYLQAAIAAWQWAMAHPDVAYSQPADVNTGAYSDATFEDEFSWAAAELYLATGEQQYLHTFAQFKQPLSVPSWSNTAALGYLSLLTNETATIPRTLSQRLGQQLDELMQQLLLQHRQSAYRVAMVADDFVWGSNAVALNKAMLLLTASRLTADNHVRQDYRQAALSLTDYVLGRNPTDYAYVTGYGYQTPMHIHHRASQSDGIEDPVPGFVAGGAQPGQQDNCDYPSDFAAESYIDNYCSYASNEVAINWNAPLVFVLASLQANL